MNRHDHSWYSNSYFSGAKRCGFQHLTNETGTISSPGYPAHYGNNLNCTTIITVGTGKRVLLNFTSINLQGVDRDCLKYDYLEVIDGSSRKIYCGSQSKKPFLSQTNELIIRFKTDSSVVFSGYYIAYGAVVPGK